VDLVDVAVVVDVVFTSVDDTSGFFIGATDRGFATGIGDGFLSGDVGE
jgi:hypothetical protein